MAAYSFFTVDVFTTQRFGGNPLAVFPDARGLSDEAMQALARELNLSETTFVLPPKDPANTARVRIFTPASEIPFAGHPNVGTAFVLARQTGHEQDELRFEEGAGLVGVTLLRDGEGGVAGAAVSAPAPLSVGVGLAAETVAACAGLDASDVETSAHEPVVASVGLPFVCAEVSAAALERAVPVVDAFRAIAARNAELREHSALYLYARDGERIHARMFAPLGGVPEDPATGSAAAALAALLLSLTAEGNATYEIVQGVKMGRPSALSAAAKRTPEGIRATISGFCVPVLEGAAQL
ncbi:MAG: PhzF family phenazine biosynthesis protein [Gammaproteobacteria bacterium]|nr:PhzF family phenazine biosynthesis protein [Gammaproteobacteria bacterium]